MCTQDMVYNATPSPATKSCPTRLRRSLSSPPNFPGWVLCQNSLPPFKLWIPNVRPDSHAVADSIILGNRCTNKGRIHQSEPMTDLKHSPTFPSQRTCEVVPRKRWYRQTRKVLRLLTEQYQYDRPPASQPLEIREKMNICKSHPRSAPRDPPSPRVPHVSGSTASSWIACCQEKVTKTESTNIIGKVPLCNVARPMSDMILQQTRLWVTRTEDDMNLLDGTHAENPQQPQSGSIKPHPVPQQNHPHSASENARFRHAYQPSPKATPCPPDSFAAKERLRI